MWNSVETFGEETAGMLHTGQIFDRPEKTGETSETPETVREQKSAAIVASLGSAFGDLSPLRTGKTEK